MGRFPEQHELLSFLDASRRFSIPASLGLTTTWNSTRSAGRTKGSMGRQATVVLYVLALVAVVVGVDVLFFRNRFWERLMVNVGIVLVFGAFYVRFLKRP
jgi:hypothetical protein